MFLKQKNTNSIISAVSWHKPEMKKKQKELAVKGIKELEGRLLLENKLKAGRPLFKLNMDDYESLEEQCTLSLFYFLSYTEYFVIVPMRFADMVSLQQFCCNLLFTISSWRYFILATSWRHFLLASDLFSDDEYLHGKWSAFLEHFNILLKKVQVRNFCYQIA